MRDFLKRITGVFSIRDFAFCEVHKSPPDKPDELHIVIGGTADWPRTPTREVPSLFSTFYSSARREREQSCAVPAVPVNLPPLSQPRKPSYDEKAIPTKNYIIQVA